MDTLSLKEATHRFWKYSTYSSAFIALLLFFLFWNTSAVMWSSIFRLGSFIFFAAAVLGYLRIMNAPLRVQLSSSKDHLLVSYEKKGEIIQEEEFERTAIKEVILTAEGSNLVSSYLYSGTAALKVRFTDSNKELFLFEFSGRPLYFDQQSLQKVQQYLQELNINAQV